MTAIELRGVTKIYGDGDAKVHALRPTNLIFAAGVFTAIMGARLQDGIANLSGIAVGEYVVIGKNDPLTIFFHNTTERARCNVPVSNADPAGCGPMTLEVSIEGTYATCFNHISCDPINLLGDEVRTTELSLGEFLFD